MDNGLVRHGPTDAPVDHGPFSNPDIAPVGPEDRKWTTFDIAALWVGMSVCIPTYMLASSLIGEGMNWWQAGYRLYPVAGTTRRAGQQFFEPLAPPQPQHHKTL